MNLKINFYCVDLHTDKILLVCPLADWARLKHVNGISFKENLELFTTPPCLDSECDFSEIGGGGGGGGGGGALRYRGGRIHSLSNFKNTPKALISGQKSTLILIKTLTFSSK